MLGVLNGIQLILRFLIREHFLKFTLPHRIRAEAVSLHRLPLRIQLHKILCNLLYRALDLVSGAGPLLRSELVQLRLRRILRGIFLKRFQLAGQNIQRASAPVFNLDIVLGNAVHLDFLHAAVDSDSVILMDHIISYLQLGKITDGFAVIMTFYLLRLAGRSENVRLGDDDKANLRVFKAVGNVPVIGHDFAVAQNPIRILTVKRSKPPLREVPGKTFCSRSRCRNDDHPVFLKLILLQIRNQCIEALVIGRNASCMDRNDTLRQKKAVSCGKCGQTKAAVIIHAGGRKRRAADKLHLSGKDIALLAPADHALPKLELHRFAFLPKMHRLIQKDHGMLFREHLEEGVGLRIKIMNVSFQASKIPVFQCCLAKLADALGKTMCCLHVPLASQCFFGLFLLFPDSVNAIGKPCVRQNQLRGRIDLHKLHGLDGSLRLQIEASDGIHLFVEKLNSIGILLRKVKDIHNIAAHSKLPWRIDLEILLIAHADQFPGKLLQRIRLPLLQLQDIALPGR